MLALTAGIDPFEGTVGGHHCQSSAVQAVVQSGAKNRSGKTGKGNPYLKGSARRGRRHGRQDRYLPRRTLPASGPSPRQAQGHGRHRPLRPGYRHLLTVRAARYHDLGASYHASRIDQYRKIRDHVRQFEALGYTVNLAPAA